MKSIFFPCLFFLISLNSFSQDSMSVTDYERAQSMLGWNTSQLTDQMDVRPRWQEDGSFWYKSLTPEGAEYIFYNPKTKEKKIANTSKEIKEGLPVSKDNPDFNYQKELPSPDWSKAIFIKDWNLWVRNLKTNEETQLTHDGIENFGYATDNAGWRHSERPIGLWSPDSKKFATYQQDQRHVNDMYMVKTKVGAPELKQWKYPLPQDEDIIRIHRVVIDIEEKSTVRFEMDSDPRRGTLCDDISCDGTFDDNVWSKDSKKLVFVSTSRDHKIAQLRIADVKSGKVRDIYKEEVDTQYESGQGTINWTYFSDTDEFIWYSERDNWGHLYLYDMKTGGLKHQITNGDFVVMSVVKFDQKNRVIYFKANGKEQGRDPYFSHFYKIDFSGKNLKLLTPENGNHSLSFSPNGRYFLDNYSKPDVPPVSVLRDMDGNLIEKLQEGDISRLIDSGWQAPMPFTVKSDNKKYDLYGLMFKPTKIEEGKKYPVINYVYPGPQGGGVGSRSFRSSRGDHQALAELGFIVIIIDGSCNPGRSKEFHDECYGDMSINTLPDQISGINQLAKNYNFIDETKVGIWGHSGGGFATAAALFRYPDFYDVGISESGNHDNRNYEDDWGERYNGLIDGVGKGTVDYYAQANQKYAKNLKGKLMIAHGAMDDNVPVSNSYLVVDALIKANKDFDLVIFPHASHGFGNDFLYMMRKRWDYFVKHLHGKTPPKEFKIKYNRDSRN